MRWKVERVRSKNAGPFWVTIDVFCGSEAVFETVGAALTADRVAARLGQPVASLRRFELPRLFVIKFSVPRPVTQGDRRDRDMHGAQLAVVVEELLGE